MGTNVSPWPQGYQGGGVGSKAGKKDRKVGGRGLHSFTFQLNLSRV